MTHSDIFAIEQQLRDAVSTGAYASVPGVLDLYCRAVEARARQLAPDDPELAELFGRFQSTADWIRLMASSARAQLADDLRKAEHLHGYLGGRPQTRTPVTVDA